MLSSLCYVIGWSWCILWGIYGHPAIAVQGAIFLIALQLYYTKMEDSNIFTKDVILVAVSIPLGFLLEMFLIQTNVIRYGDSAFPPAWIIAIYPLFALLINHVFSFLKGNATAAYFIGFLGIPSSYFWIRSHGALSFGYSDALTWFIIGTCWGILFALLLKITRYSK